MFRHDLHQRHFIVWRLGPTRLNTALAHKPEMGAAAAANLGEVAPAARLCLMQWLFY